MRRYASYAPQERRIVVHDGPDASVSVRVASRRAVMSARSIDRPRVKNCHTSSRLVALSMMPTASALRSRTQAKNSCTLSPATLRGIRARVVLRHSQSSVETISRARRAFSRAAPSE